MNCVLQYIELIRSFTEAILSSIYKCYSGYSCVGTSAVAGCERDRNHVATSCTECSIESTVSTFVAMTCVELVSSSAL